MKKLTQYISCVMLSLGMAMATPAAADEVDSILGLLADAGIVDPALVDAKDLIRCLTMSSSPETCVNLQQVGKDLQSDAVSEAEKQAAQFLPDDPAVRAVVDIIRAANSQDWIRVLELTGVKLLGQIACKSTLTMTGPLQPFVCGKFGTLVLDNAEPVVHEVLVVLKDFPNVNVWDLISAATLDLACKIVEDTGAPFVAEACGVLGQALAAIISLGGDLLGAINDGLTAVNEFLTGGGSAMYTADEYYSRIVRPLMYKRALERLVSNRQNLGMDQQEVSACFGYGGIVYGSKCTKEMSARLQKESEAMVKLVLAMPESYLSAFLLDEVKKRAVDRYGQGNDLLQYVNNLPIADWAQLVDGQGVSLMAAYTGINEGDQKYLKDLWRECNFWVNEKLTGSRNNGVPYYEEIEPGSLSNWICFKGAAQNFLQAQVKEEKRLAGIRQGLNNLGCPSIPGQRFSFDCQSHISFSICVHQSYKDYGENRYCKADRDKTAHSLGVSLINALGETRCRYVPLSKGNFGDFDPRVQCSRPWKQQTCDALLTTFRAKFEVPSSRIQMRCAYNPDKDFLAAEARAKQILAVLNGGPTAEFSPDIGRRSLPSTIDSTFCKTLWDPLAINCPHQTKMPTLTGDLAMPAIESCPADPNKNGADHVCYQTVFTAGDSNREIFENQPLSPVSANTQDLPPSPAGPVRAGTVSRQPVPSPVATTGSATMLPGAAAQSAPVISTMSGTPPGQPEPDPTAAPTRTAAPAIRAMNTQRDEVQAPPNPCRMTVSYYVPQAPIVSAISTRLLVNDQFQIQCSFKKVTREVEWPRCDDAARTSMQILKLSKEAGSRYSGIVAIDGNTVGVSSSPEDGSDFAGTKIWKFENPGAHDVSCQVDNALRYAAEGAPTYLNSAVSFDVSARSDGLTYRRFEPESASTLSVKPLPSEAAPSARDGRFRMLQNDAPARSNDVPASEPTAPRSGFTGVRQSQGDVAMSNDMNDAGSAVASPAARSASGLRKSATVATADPNATAIPWNRTVLSCLYYEASGPKIGNLKTYQIRAHNESTEAIQAGETIHWRLNGSGSLGGGIGGGISKKWTQGNSHALQDALPIGAVISVGEVSVMGTASGCEAWAQ